MCVRFVCPVPGGMYLDWEVWAACPLANPHPRPLPRHVGARVLSRSTAIGTGMLL
jgi:hypothetical protein